MKKPFWMLFVTSYLICFGSVKDTDAIEPLIISSSQSRFELSPHLEILEDKNRQWTIDDVSSPSFSERFRPINSKVINLGITDSAIWMRFRIDVKTLGDDTPDTFQKWYLDFDRDFLEQCNLFIPRVSVEQASVKDRWRIIGSAGRVIMDTMQPVALPLEFQLPDSLESPLTLYLRVQHSAALFLPLTLYSNEAFLSRWI